MAPVLPSKVVSGVRGVLSFSSSPRANRTLSSTRRRGSSLLLRRATTEDEGSSTRSSDLASTSLVRSNAPEGFAQLERAIKERLAESNLIPEESGWEIVEGCWCFDDRAPQWPGTSGRPRAWWCQSWLIRFLN